MATGGYTEDAGFQVSLFDDNHVCALNGWINKKTPTMTIIHAFFFIDPPHTVIMYEKHIKEMEGVATD